MRYCTIKNELTGARMNSFIRTAEEFIDTKGAKEVIRRFGSGSGDIGAVWELEAAKILKTQGKNVVEFGEKLPFSVEGDIVVLSSKGEKIIYEAKGWKWDSVTEPFIKSGDWKKTLLDQSKKMADLASSGGIKEYKFVFRTAPSDPKILKELSDLNIPWEVIQ